MQWEISWKECFVAIKNSKVYDIFKLFTIFFFLHYFTFYLSFLYIYLFHKSNKECRNVKEITETCISLSIFKIDPNRHDKYTKYMKPYNYNRDYYDLRTRSKMFKIFFFSLFSSMRNIPTPRLQLCPRMNSGSCKKSLDIHYVD